MAGPVYLELGRGGEEVALCLDCFDSWACDHDPGSGRWPPSHWLALTAQEARERETVRRQESAETPADDPSARGCWHCGGPIDDLGGWEATYAGDGTIPPSLVLRDAAAVLRGTSPEVGEVCLLCLDRHLELFGRWTGPSARSTVTRGDASGHQLRPRTTERTSPRLTWEPVPAPLPRSAAPLAITGNWKRKKRGGPYLGGVAFAPSPNPFRCRFCAGSCSLKCADALEDVIHYHTSGDVAAFVAEPIQGEGGIIVPPPGYFERVREILQRHGILLIVDEVQTGFGRTGRMFGIKHYAVEPDIMAVAKGIASGFPLGAFIARSDIADSFQPGEHLSTFGGNPVSCAAALATVDVLIQEALSARAEKLGSWVRESLRQLGRRHPSIGDVRGRGLMVGMVSEISR